MKYILLIYQNAKAWDGLDEAQRSAMMGEAGAIVEKLIASGEWVGGDGLADPATARTARVRNGVPAVTDGPFAEAKEQVVGYAIVECGTEARAVEIALEWPDSRLWGVEVRRLLSSADEKM